MTPELPSPNLADDVCRVLVADDEPAILNDYRQAFSPQDSHHVREMADLAIELFGVGSDTLANGRQAFDLTVCAQGEDAVAAVQKAIAEGRPFSAAFIDVRMPPGIDGVTSAERIQKLDPGLTTVIVTGYSDTPRNEIANRLNVGQFLYFQKPFLADEFTQLAWTLHCKRKAEDGLRDLNASLHMQVEQRSFELKEALHKALAATQAKSTFLSNMSHELRTPLNAIIGFSDIIRSQLFGAVGEARYVSYATDINLSAQHLLELINDILDYSKIEAGGLVLSDDVADPDEMIAFATRLVAVKADEKQVKISHRPLREPISLTCDERRVKQVLLNIIVNAIKFSHRDSAVNISVFAENGLTIEIADVGVGMTPTQVEQALEPFTQVEGAYSRSQEGTGLGLTISLALMRLHGGDLCIASAPDVGTTVSLRFPADRVRVHPITLAAPNS